MKHTIIYQIGRLDRNVFDICRFVVEDEQFDTSLTSFAIRDFIKQEGKAPLFILIYPVSLPFNTFLLNNQTSFPPEFMKEIEATLNDPEGHLKDPQAFFKHHPHTEEADDLFVTHSLGIYSTHQSPISFDCHYQDILLEMLLDMVDRYLPFLDVDTPEPIEYIIDISSGHNIYVSALLEAARQFGVWLQLAGWHNKAIIPEIKVAFSDPILPGQDVLHTIHFDELKVRSLFSSPITNNDVSNFTLSRRVFPDESERREKGRLQGFLERFLIVFSAIKNNTPLAIYQFGFDEGDATLNVLKDFILYTRKRLFSSYLKSPALDKDTYLKVLLTLGFYYGLGRMLKERGPENLGDNGWNIQDIKKSFYKIYQTFGLNLNVAVLGNEINQILEASNRLNDKISGQWHDLFILLNPTKNQFDTKPNKRNFFAHAGLEQNATQFRIEDGSLFLRYKADCNENLKNWLKESA